MANGLVPDIGFQLGRGVQTFGQLQQQQLLREQAAAQAAQQQQLQGLLGQITPGQQPVPQLGAQAPVVQPQAVPQQLSVQPAVAPQAVPAVQPAITQQQAQQQLETFFPQQAQQIAAAQKANFENRTAREKQRITSVVQSAAGIQGLPVEQQIRKLEQNRERFISQNIPTNDTDEQLRLLREGRIDEANVLTDQAVQLGEQLDILKEPAAPARAKVIAETDKIRAEADKIRAETGRPRVSDKERAETEKLRAEADKIRAETVKGGPLSKQDIEILKEERKETVKANVKRISNLTQSSKSRNLASEKASEFLRLIEGGAETGTTRRLLGFLPGVFTTQAVFDQKFDSFTEVAAREKLKAVGEIRPTDADVEGMKRALFGVNRDEETNIQLLTEFIAEQEALDQELEDLRAAKKRGELAEFTGAELPTEDIDLTTLTLDQLIELRRRTTQ